MATDLTAFQQRVQTRMRKKIGDHRNDMFLVCKPIIEDAQFIEVGDLDGGNNFTAQSGATKPSASDVRAFKSTSNPTVYEINVPLTDDQLQDWEKAADAVADLLLTRGWNKIANDFWTILFSLRTIPHPEEGVSGSPLSPVGGGVLYAIDNITVDPINGGSPFNQNGNATLALNTANLRTQLNLGPNWRDRDGGATKPRGQPWLVVVSELGGTAKNLYARKGETYDGSGLVEGFADELAGVIVVPKGVTAAVDAWALVYLTETLNDEGGIASIDGPIMVHIKKLPMVEVSRESGAGFVNVYASMTYDVFLHPIVDRDVFYSEP